MTREEVLEQLYQWRSRIDAVDVQLVELLNQRTGFVEHIGRLKQHASLPVYEPKREDEVFQNITDNNSGPLPDEALRRIFERIIDEMRTVQRDRMQAREDSESC
jgi:chorismate mutase/prephenate dehydratase